MENKNFLTKIIAKDEQGLQMISACCSEAKIQINQIKYLSKNKIFLIYLERFNKESNGIKKKLNSICKFEFIESVKSKNIDLNNKSLVLELVGINFYNKGKNKEINLIFSKNAYIMLLTEIIEVSLEDQY